MVVSCRFNLVSSARIIGRAGSRVEPENRPARGKTRVRRAENVRRQESQEKCQNGIGIDSRLSEERIRKETS